MRELLSLRRDEAPIIGEVYRYKNEFLKCVADNPGESCAKCAFDETTCGCLCDAKSVFPLRHFESVHKNELETAADVKFRHIEETKDACAFVGEHLIAAVGLVEFVVRPKNCLDECVLCDLTQRECDESACGCGCFYRKVKQ